MSLMHRSGWNMKRACRVAACLVVTLATCCAATAASDQSHGVMLDVRDARLGEVVLLLTQQSGANIFINPDVADKKVTAHAENMALDRALELIVRATAGVDYWKDDDGNYVIGGQRPDVAKAPALVEPPVFTATPEPVYVAPVYRTQTLKLQNVDPTDMLVALGVLSPYRDFFGGKSVPVAAIIDEDKFTMEPMNNSSNNLGIIRVNDRAVPTVDPGSTGMGGAGVSATRDTGSGQYGYRPPSTPGRTASAAPTQAAGANNNSLMPEGVTSVMPYSLDNSLIVRGTEEGIAELKDVVHLLDIAPKQVMIKAEFIEVSTDDVKNFGIDWSINRLNQSLSTIFNPGGNVLYNLQSGNLTAALRTQLSQNSGKTINSPIITCLNNEVGQIQIQRSIPYWTSTVVTNATTNTSTGVGSSNIAYSVHSLDVATGLSVLPRVNGDGTITLTMAPQVQDTGTIYTGPDGTQIPETRSQSIAIRRRVMSGETIVCGGFIRKQDSNSVNKIPILADLPIIGSLFRSTQKSSNETELLIFVTPSIIGERSAGSSVGVSP
jgi:type II secretory pathway component GspD/PulD (secretin)